ncbi:sensor histidine kinase [Sphingobacterium cellulitidis]|uniref:histidine kinase n=1 Tax=Sphingobacterium cellulitidis TaxID=1768011 RepID=A0A8H9G497_9SPHI|nr:HAMP domain-containing sensor histidine kinase [Sphingobacterium soli]MBA8988680.1 two-component system sensor histidine kinase VicK [Sphingobacterium soli]GGE34781.1 hypothetical protein GCM10011516_35500 [Sphingobacterium soli]
MDKINNALRVLSENSFLMVFTFDPKSGILGYMNHSFRFFSKFLKNSINFWEILKYADTEESNLLRRDILNISESPIEKRVIKISFEGNIKYLKMSIYQYNISKNQMNVGYAEDITDEIEFQQNILLHNAKKNAILNILSHDISGSLATVKNLTKLASEKVQKNDFKSIELALASINDICSSNMSLISSFLKKEFITSLSIPLNLVRTDLVVCLKNLIKQYSAMESSTGINFILQCESSSLFLYVDEDKFIQIMNNLISNSLKFTHKGGYVIISVRDLGETINISVKDTGIGIPQEMKSQIFNKFSNSKRPGINGESTNGIGLWVVKTVVEWMGGGIKCESVENQGCEFIIDLPKRGGIS